MLNDTLDVSLRPSSTLSAWLWPWVEEAGLQAQPAAEQHGKKRSATSISSLALARVTKSSPMQTFGNWTA